MPSVLELLIGQEAATAAAEGDRSVSEGVALEAEEEQGLIQEQNGHGPNDPRGQRSQFADVGATGDKFVGGEHGLIETLEGAWPRASHQGGWTPAKPPRVPIGGGGSQSDKAKIGEGAKILVSELPRPPDVSLMIYCVQCCHY